MTFKIPTHRGLVHQEGETITLSGHECFITSSGSGKFLYLHDYKSGIAFANAQERGQLIALGHKTVKEHTSFEIHKLLKGQCTYLGFKDQYPLNK